MWLVGDVISDDLCVVVSWLWGHSMITCRNDLHGITGLGKDRATRLIPWDRGGASIMLLEDLVFVLFGT